MHYIFKKKPLGPCKTVFGLAGRSVFQLGGSVLRLGRIEAWKIGQGHITIDIRNQIETNYRVLKDAKSRALRGISKEGGRVFSIGMANTDLYTSFASHLRAVSNAIGQIESVSYSELKNLDCGNQDMMVEPEATRHLGKRV
jgi:hypothetical protein